MWIINQFLSQMFNILKKIDEQTVTALETVLRDKYGFLGTLKDIKFKGSSRESFRQLIEVLESSDIITRLQTTSITETDAPPQASSTVEPTTSSSVLNTTIVEEDTTPQIGDRAFVYWYGNGWFTATIEDWIPDDLEYLIRWTDGNWRPERASHSNLCVDKVPNPSSVGVGTKVLFKQGLYYCGYRDDGSLCAASGEGLTESEKRRIGQSKQISDRWHMGRITRIAKTAAGETLYSGEHVGKDDPQVSKQNYPGYTTTFENLRLSELRILPNIYNCLDTSSSSANDTKDMCDVFVSRVSEDIEAVRRIVGHLQNQYIVQESGSGASAADIQGIVSMIKNCSVYLVCLSDSFIDNPQAMSELLYAKKTLQKTVVPIIIGTSGKWQQTTAGMLLAGQLYIQFSSEDVFEEKSKELQNNLGKLIVSDTNVDAGENTEAVSEYAPRVFLSYCWTNSKASFDAGQIGNFIGHIFSDPRKIKSDIENAIGETVWLDIEQLNSVDDSGMFGQIAEGLLNSSVVVMCVSKEYTKSQNCQMEANFALRSLHKKTIVVEVGTGVEEDRNAWTKSSVGMVLPINHHPFIFTEDKTKNSDDYNLLIELICAKLREEDLSEPVALKTSTPLKTTSKKKEDTSEESSLRATIPMKGDSVVAHYAAWQFFPAKVVSFDKGSMKYTVDWDDPDPQCRVQSYHLVAVNVTPTDNMIGIGSSILFKQGTYGYMGSTGDVWNLGEITRVTERDGVEYYSGKHSKTAADGLAVATWPSYRPTFEGARSHDLRLFPNAMEMLQAYKNL